MAVEVEQIEHHQVEILRPTRDRRAQRMEVRKALFIEHYRLAVEDETFSFQRLGLRGERTVLGRPVDAALGVEADAVFVKCKRSVSNC